MVQKNSLKKVIAIVGPTGVGKTNISISIAKKYNAEIINCDQSQMHKELNIGTAKITKDEMNGIKHHLIDFLNPEEEYSIKDFQDEARNIIDKMNCLPIIVGGSGLYVDALINDYDLSVSKRNVDTEKKYANLTNEELYQTLYSLNEEAALKTHPNNRKRVLRYLEIVNENGKIKEKDDNPYYDALIIFLNKDRNILYNNINKRCEEMIINGWINEVNDLIKQGYNINSIKEIGYKDIKNYLYGLVSLDEVKEKIKKDTRHYAKRQITWFKNKMNCVEVINDSNAFEKICILIDDFINK